MDLSYVLGEEEKNIKTPFNNRSQIIRFPITYLQLPYRYLRLTFDKSSQHILAV